MDCVSRVPAAMLHHRSLFSDTSGRSKMLIPHYLRGLNYVINGDVQNNMRFKIVSLTALALVALWMMAMKYYQISSSAHTIPVRQLSPLPTFTKVTVYRSDPDIIFENYLDAGLVKLKLSYLSTSNTAAWPMKIFQTARKIDPKYKDAISSWSAYNPQYEHMVNFFLITY